MLKTLVVQHYPGIGDLIWHVPYIKAVASGSLHGKVSLLVRPTCRAEDIFAAETCIDTIIHHDYKRRDRSRGRHDGLLGELRLARELRPHRFNRIVIFSDRSRYPVIGLLAGIPRRIGYGFRMSQRIWLTDSPYITPFNGPGSTVYDEATRFAMAHGFVEGKQAPKVSVSAALAINVRLKLGALPTPRVALAIGASDASKDWGADQFLSLARRLTLEGYGVVVVGGPAERARAESTFTAENGLVEGRVETVCEPSVQASAAAIKACDITIGNDTAALNLSVACDVPAIGLFGHTLPLQHDPLLHSIAGPDMKSIDVDAVLEKLHQLQAGRTGRSATQAT